MTPGSKLNSQLVWVPRHKCLYVRNTTNADGFDTYVCIDCKTVPYRCPARNVLMDKDNCKYTDRSKLHTGHETHEKIYKKNVIYDKFKRSALDIAETCGWQSEKIKRLNPSWKKYFKGKVQGSSFSDERDTNRGHGFVSNYFSN